MLLPKLGTMTMTTLTNMQHVGLWLKLPAGIDTSHNSIDVVLVESFLSSCPF